MTETPEVVTELFKNTEVELDFHQTGESWDSDNVEHRPVGDIIGNIEKNAEKRGILRNHQNMPPAERKAKREEDRQKNRTRVVSSFLQITIHVKIDNENVIFVSGLFQNAQEQAKLNSQQKYSSTATTSAVAASIVNNRSACNTPLSSTGSDVFSDSSYNTALDVANQFQEFQLVSNKRGRGRAARDQQTSSNVSSGIGRGRPLNK